MNRRWDAVIVFLLILSVTVLYAQGTPVEEYNKVKTRLAKGWNTWNTHSFLSHVLLPQGLGINIGFKEQGLNIEKNLDNVLNGKQGEGAESVKPGYHAWDASYTELELNWLGNKIRVQSAIENRDLFLLVTPLESKSDKPLIVYTKAGMLWNRSGTVKYDAGHLDAVLADSLVRIYASKTTVTDPSLSLLSPYLAVELDGAVGFCTGSSKTLAEIRSVINQKEMDLRSKAQAFGNVSDAYLAMQSVVAWNTIYDAGNDRVISTSNRLQNHQKGGWVLNSQDVLYSTFMAAIDYKDLAIANIIELLNERTDLGFVPGTIQGNGKVTLDRSTLPLGSKAVLTLYKKYNEKWLLEQTFEALLSWNRWWDIYRNYDGLLCWGSNPYDNPYNDPAVGNLRAAILESGMVNSPMYDLVPFNNQTQLMELWDVGLNSMYLMDCKALAEIATILGKTDERELQLRINQYSENMERLWSQSDGLYLNVRADSEEKSKTISPTCFYPLLAEIPSPDRAKKIIEEHLLDPQKFWGSWVVPSVSKKDPAFKDNNYWRGRIVAPMNFMLYLGLTQYDLSQAKSELADKSRELLLNEWLTSGYISENYNTETGMGSDIEYNEQFYLLSGLLGLVALMEADYF